MAPGDEAIPSADGEGGLSGDHVYANIITIMDDGVFDGELIDVAVDGDALAGGWLAVADEAVFYQYTADGIGGGEAVDGDAHGALSGDVIDAGVAEGHVAHEAAAAAGDTDAGDVCSGVVADLEAVDDDTAGDAVGIVAADEERGVAEGVGDALDDDAAEAFFCAVGDGGDEGAGAVEPGGGEDEDAIISAGGDENKIAGGCPGDGAPEGPWGVGVGGGICLGICEARGGDIAGDGGGGGDAERAEEQEGEWKASHDKKYDCFSYSDI